MHPDFTNLIASSDGQSFLNYNVVMASSLKGNRGRTDPAMISPVPCDCAENNAPVSNRLSDFNERVEDGDDFVDRACIQLINQIKSFDSTNVDKYSLYYQQYNENEAYVNIAADEPPTTQLIQRFSFNVGIWDDPTYGKVARFYINGLYVNVKYADVGSTLLSLAKAAMTSLVTLAQLNMGTVELYSVESAVLFYIKNGFMIRDLVIQQDPQSSTYGLHKIIHFAMKEDNIEIVKMFANVTQENFSDFIDYLLTESKYGKFFSAYFDAKSGAPNNEIQKSVMESKFISSLFDTNMVYKYIRDPYKARVNLKPLTM